MRQLFFLSVAVLGALAVAQASKGHDFFARPAMPGQPPYPIWPKQFSANYDVSVPAYGKDFKYKGVIHYDYTIHSARAFYYDWCIPLFDDSASAIVGTKGQQGMYNHTCSFLMTAKGTYFISPNFPFVPNRCCYFGPIPPPTPDWLKNTQWNGTATLRGSQCNVWWFPGTDDPSDPYYGYWSKIDPDNTPVRFLGLSSIGVTILDYTSFTKGPVHHKMFEVPDGCSAECKSPP